MLVFSTFSSNVKASNERIVRSFERAAAMRQPFLYNFISIAFHEIRFMNKKRKEQKKNKNTK